MTETKFLSIKSDVRQIIAILNAGGIILFPTETVYGLGCDGTNAQAVLKVYRIKGRELGKPFPLLVKDFKILSEYAIFNNEQKAAMTAVKQPTTFILKAKNLSPLVMQNHTAAFRISRHVFVKKLFRYFDRPIVATSANLVGQPPLKDPAQHQEIFGDRARLIDVIVSDGANKRTKPSRIIDLIKKPYKIIRG